MNDVRIPEATEHVNDCINVTDVTEEFVTKQPVEIMRIINNYGEVWVHYYDYFPSKGFTDFGHKVALDVLNDYGDLQCDYDEVSADGNYKTNFLMLKEFD